jgi:hypothetical protein
LIARFEHGEEQWLLAIYWYFQAGEEARTFSTAVTNSSAAAINAASVVGRPQLMRRQQAASASVSPSASSTCEASALCELQAEPVLKAKCRKALMSEAAGACLNQMLLVLGSLPWLSTIRVVLLEPLTLSSKTYA